MPADGPLFAPGPPLLVCTTAAADRRIVDAWCRAGVEVVVLPGAPGGGVDLDAVWTELGGRGVLQVLVEGGASVLGACLAGGHVRRLVTYVAPLALGTGGRPSFDVPGPPTLDDAVRWRLDGVHALGDDVRIDWVADRGPDGNG